jgi:hypothetical protein
VALLGFAGQQLACPLVALGRLPLSHRPSMTDAGADASDESLDAPPRGPRGAPSSPSAGCVLAGFVCRRVADCGNCDTALAPPSRLIPAKTDEATGLLQDPLKQAQEQARGASRRPGACSQTSPVGRSLPFATRFARDVPRAG